MTFKLNNQKFALCFEVIFLSNAKRFLLEDNGRLFYWGPLKG